MNLRRTFTIIAGTCVTSVLAIWAVGIVESQSTSYAQERRVRDRRSDQDDVEFLTQGPLHEAFAEPIVFEPERGLVVTARPPEPVEEIPPDQAPADVDAVWIPGYWSWDEPRGDFIWVSGIWRVLPPDMDWVPGYWAQSGNGYVWVAGFWRPTTLQEVAYLPEPPQSLDQGPVGDPPSEDHIWASGSWVWNENRYAWRPGYYVQARPNWSWTPAHYVWSPMGYVFVDGFWDHSIDRRGVVFAPAYFHGPVYRGYALSPSVVIDVNLFTDHLFVGPRYGHYYFGDYYDYVGAGIYPWFDFHLGHHGYDPIFAYYHWHHHHDRRWVNNLRDDFRYRRDHHDARPPHRWSEMERFADRGFRGDRSLSFASSFDKYTARRDSNFKFTKLDDNRRNEIKDGSKKFREYKNTRVSLESERSDKSALKSKESTNLKFTSSPLANREHAGKDREKAPDKPKTPQLESDKEAKSRDRDRDRTRDGDRTRDRAREQDRDADRTRDRDGDRARGRDQATPQDRSKTDRTKADQDRDRNRATPLKSQVEPRDRQDRRDQEDRARAEQQRERARADQSRSKSEPRDERRERSYAVPESTRPRNVQPGDRTRSDEVRPRPNESRDRQTTEPVRPGGERGNPERERADQAKARAEQQARERERADQAKARAEQQARERERADQAKARAEQQARDQAKARAEQQARERTRTDRPQSTQPQDRSKQDKKKSEERREQPRTRTDDPREGASNRARPVEREAKKDSNRPGNERANQSQRSDKPSGNQSGPDRGKTEPERGKDQKEKDKKNP